MKVRATRLGYYGHVRMKTGDVFDLVEVEGFKRNKAGKNEPCTFSPKEQFTDTWMEAVDDKEVVTKAPLKKGGGKNRKATQAEDVI